MAVLQSPTPLFSQRLQQAEKIRAHWKAKAIKKKPVKRHTFNKKRLPASRDPLGSGADDNECLLHTFRNLGLTVLPNRPGKKRALRDGNQMLQGTGFHLEEQAIADLQPGNYVVVSMSFYCNYH